MSSFFQVKLNQYLAFFNSQNLDSVLGMLDDSLQVEYQNINNGKEVAKAAYIADFEKKKRVSMGKLVAETEDDQTVKIRVELHLMPDKLNIDVTYTFAKSNQKMTHHLIHSVTPIA